MLILLLKNSTTHHFTGCVGTLYQLQLQRIYHYFSVLIIRISADGTNLALQDHVFVTVRQRHEQLKFTTFIQHDKKLSQAVLAAVGKRTTIKRSQFAKVKKTFV